MNNKTILGIVIAIVVIVGGIYLFTKSTPTTDNLGASTEQNKQINEIAAAQGRAVFSVTDAAANMSTISEINMKVNRVAVHSSANGWVTVSETPRVYSLLSLNARKQSELLADVQMDVGTYDQVRLTIDSISIKTKAGSTEEAKLPSGELKINTNLVVNKDTTSSINFDFLADKSLHITGNGEYIFAPVVKTQTKSNAEVSVNAKSVVTIEGGSIDNTNTAGMDIDGSVKVDFQIKKDQKLNLDTNNVIKVEGLLN